MGHRKFSDIAGEINPERRARIDATKANAWAEIEELDDRQQRLVRVCSQALRREPAHMSFS